MGSATIWILTMHRDDNLAVMGNRCGTKATESWDKWFNRGLSDTRQSVTTPLARSCMSWILAWMFLLLKHAIRCNRVFYCYRNLFKMAFRLIPSLFLGNLSLPEFRHPRRHLLVHRANLHCVPWLLARDSGLRYGQHNSYMLFAMFLTFMAGMQRSRYRGADSCR